MKRIGFAHTGVAPGGRAMGRAGRGAGAVPQDAPALARSAMPVAGMPVAGILAATMLAATILAAPGARAATRPVLTAEASVMPVAASPSPSPAAPAAEAGPAGVDGAPAPMVAGYRLGVGDRVTITVYGEDELSREYVVGPGGTISLPLIGEITARGRTADDLRDEITRKLGNGFINNPTVTLMITAFRNFYILGEVNKPGEYAYESGLTVTQAVAEAAGFTYRAAKRYAYIRHEGDLTETRVAITPDLAVEPGDTIRLGERYF